MSGGTTDRNISILIRLNGIIATGQIYNYVLQVSLVTTSKSSILCSYVAHTVAKA